MEKITPRQNEKKSLPQVAKELQKTFNSLYPYQTNKSSMLERAERIISERFEEVVKNTTSSLENEKEEVV